MNYLYYYLAGRWAAEQGADEALILNPDESISESNSANVLLITDKRITRPVSPHVLAGIMEQKVCELLLSWGYREERKILRLEDLFSADNLLVTNSLIGALPVIVLDGKGLKSPSDLYKKINDTLL
jgi:para-aminobenzoate synthetase component 1